MKQDELTVGQPVWWQRKREYADGLVMRRAAVITMLPNRLNGLAGIALRRQWGDDWYPMWLSPRQLTARAITTEAIPAFFAAVAAWTATKLERHYDHLAYVAASLPTGHVAVLAAQSSLAQMERAAASLDLVFRRDAAGHVRLVEMADCDIAAFIAATHAASEVAL